MKKLKVFTVFILLTAAANAQIKTGNDVTAPLHAMKVNYPVPYEPMAKEDIKKVLDRVFNYVDAVTPAQMINKKTNEVVADVSKIDSNTILQKVTNGA
jgi:unsaturated rhamnogalacturonyl hydrolase